MPPTEGDRLPADFESQVIADVAAFFGSHVPGRVTSTTRIRNPYSDVYRIAIKLGEQFECVYVKLPHHTAANHGSLKRRLKTEFEVMRTLSERWHDNTRHGVIEPIAYYPEIPAIVTREALGRQLRERYRTSARIVGLPGPRKNLFQSVSHCGKWLKEFQLATVVDRRPFDIDELLTYCEIRIKLLISDADAGVSNDLAGKLIKTAEKISQTTLAQATLVSGRHNDFASHNVISSGSSIHVIDFSMFDYGATAYDPCNFWLELEMLKYDWTYSRDVLSALQERFMSAYGEITPNDPVFMLARVRYSLNRLLTALSDRSGWRPDARYRRRAAEVSRDWLLNFANRGEQ
ncbi:MAG: hypothetical protein CVU28_00110 [Betaproteobacteria bacterium HGW-Betaproteobacteria-21]|jgi:hypothetical protein|nr:MAG: hypothetical protein CVU28_00110 [Betaproteobacteria bacterium HGW-Betaproteobacteria-21]